MESVAGEDDSEGEASTVGSDVDSDGTSEDEDAIGVDVNSTSVSGEELIEVTDVSV